MKYFNKSVDINSMLKYVNLIILASIWYTYLDLGPNEYVNLWTIVYSSFLCIEIHVFLVLEKQRRDPFVLLLSIQMIFYFILRVLTLIIFSFSNVFTRLPFSPADLNYSILFIIAANAALYLGLSLNVVKTPDVKFQTRLMPLKSINIIYLLIFGFAFMFLNNAGIGIIANMLGLVNSLFINLSVIIFMILVYVLLFYNSINKQHLYIILFLLLLFIGYQTLTGSRSAILTLVNFIMFGMLAVKGLIKTKKIYLILFAILTPVMIGVFLLATFLRPRLDDRAKVNSETISVITEFDLMEMLNENSDVILGGISDRVGFLDYCSEIIAHSDQYNSVFNSGFYFKSIVDNVLTPGFDFFDTPKVSNAIRFIYNGDGIPLKSKVGEGYQSDEFTFYGEFYALFGKWVSLIPIFFVGFAFKRYYVKISDSNIFRFYMKRAFALYLYFILLNSFGLDWLLFDIVGIVCTYFLFKRYFKVSYEEKIRIIG